MSIDPSRLAEGMQVVDPVGKVVGRIKAVRDGDFLLDMTLRRDVYVPLRFVSELRGGAVALSVRADEVSEMGWAMPPLLGGPHASTAPATDPEDRVVGRGDPAERGTWAAASDSYQVEPLDTTEGRLPTEGTDDGQRLRPADTTELQRLRDTAG